MKNVDPGPCGHAAAVTARPEDCLIGGGRMGELMRTLDWSATGLGPISQWPQSLRTSVSTCLNSRFPILIWWGPQFVMLYNDAYSEIIAAKHPRALGQPGCECWPEIWDIIGPMLHGVRERGEATWSENQYLPLERHGYAEECYFTFSYSPIRDENGIGGVFCAVTETTQQVLGPRRLALLTQVATVASAAASEAQCWQLVTHALEDSRDLPFAVFYVPGSTPGSLRRAAATHAAPDASVCPERVDREALQAIADKRRAVLLPVGRPGAATYGYLLAGLNPERPLDSQYRSFLELVADHAANAVSTSRAIEEERTRAESLARLDQAKTVFFSNVSHEFRTPLTLILGPVEDLLADEHEPLGPSQRERMEILHRSALRLQRLVNSLLDFARIEAGRAHASYVATDLGAFVGDLASVFRSAVERAGLRLDVEAAPGMPVAYVDRDMWERIVMNLLSNALKFTFEGGIAVKVWSDAGRFHVAVADSGIGIAPENLPVLFERFRRIEGSRSRTHEGSGIGLALVQELARLHGGRVEVASEAGRGTTFTVTIPQGNAHLPPEHVQAVCIPPRATAGAHAFVQEALGWSRDAECSLDLHDGHQGRRRIVLADDNADMRDYLRKLLATRYDVEAVSDGAAALEACRRRMPDLVVSDLMMPRLDGMQLVHALRSGLETRHVPVILLSARADEDSRIEALNAGAQDYLFKPFRAHELLARVAVRLEMGSLESIVERQRSALLAVFAESPVPIAVMSGENLVFELANPAYQATVGRGNLLGRALLEALPEMRGQGFDDLLREVLRTGRPFVGKERPATIHRDGKAHETFYDFVYAPLRDLAGNTTGVISVAQDVTAQVQSRHAFQEAARNKDQFIAMMAHELRNPLAPIRNAVELLKIAGDDPARRNVAVAIMDRQVRYSCRLVDDLLDMSRIAQGKLLIRRESATLANILESAVETGGPYVNAAGQRLAVHAPPGRIALHADPVRISQVVANLLSNAAKFGRRGDTVIIEAAVHGNWVEIAVSDQGIGIDPCELHVIFDMFTQVSGRGEAGGLGIGLTLSRKLVELHGGTLEASSEGLGKGSRFTVRLPCSAAAHAERGHRRTESAQ